MPDADFCSAVRLPFSSLSRRDDTKQISWGKLSRFPCTAAESTLRTLMEVDFAVRCPLVRYWRLVSGFCPSTRTFDPCFLRTPPRGGSPCIITRPSPPSGWPEDFHLQAAEHAQHTAKARAAHRPPKPAPTITTRGRVPIMAPPTNWIQNSVAGIQPRFPFCHPGRRPFYAQPPPLEPSFSSFPSRATPAAQGRRPALPPLGTQTPEAPHSKRFLRHRSVPPLSSTCLLLPNAISAHWGRLVGSFPVPDVPGTRPFRQCCRCLGGCRRVSPLSAVSETCRCREA